MSNYLNNLNQIIKINTAAVSNTENKDSFLLTTKRSRDDLNKIANYINNLLVPSLKSLASGPRYMYDAAQVGISGLTIVTYPEAQGNNSSNSELYWIPGAIAGTGRPATVKESFDYLLESLIDRVVEVQNSTIDLSGITDDIACSGFNLQKIQTDVLGAQYPLDCSSNNIFNWPLAKHLYEILSQLTTGLDVSLIENLNNGATYPDLRLNLNANINLNDLQDVATSGASIGDGLVFDGNTWVPGTINIVEATEETSGTVEIASARDIAFVASTGDSTSGSSYLAVTTEALYNSLESDAVNAGSGEINLFRDKVKEVAFEKLTESSIFDLSDTDQPNILLNKQALIYNGDKFINRNIVWDDIQMRPSVTEPILYSETQNSTITNTKQDYTDQEKIELLKSHNTLSYKKSSGKWEIEAYKNYKGLSPAISYGADPFKSTLVIPGYLNKKVPFTVCFAYKNGQYYASGGNVILAPGASQDYIRYSTELEEEINLFDEIENPKSRVMSSNTQWWESNENAFYNLNSDAIGIYRTDKSYLRTTGNKFLNTNNTENSYFSIYKNLTIETDIMTEGESLVIVLGPYECSDKLYACPSYINRRYGLLNKEVTFCISDTFISSNDFYNYVLNEGIDEAGYSSIKNQILSNQNFIGIVTKKYNRNSSVGGRVDTGLLGVVDFGLNTSDSHKLCSDLLDIDGNFSTGIQFYEFIDGIWSGKYGANKDYFNQTQRESIAKLVEFSLAYCKLKL
jgi:hypothetical protein